MATNDNSLDLAATLFYQACLLGQIDGLDCVKRLLAAGYGPLSWPRHGHCHDGLQYSRELYFNLCFRLAVLGCRDNLALIKLLLTEQEALDHYNAYKTEILLSCGHGCGRDNLLRTDLGNFWLPPVCNHELNLSLVKLLMQYGFDDRWTGALKLALQRQDRELIRMLVIRDEIFVDDDPGYITGYYGSTAARRLEFDLAAEFKIVDQDIKTLLRQFKLYRDRSDSYLIYLVQWWLPDINIELNQRVYRLNGVLDRSLRIAKPILIAAGVIVAVVATFHGLLMV